MRDVIQTPRRISRRTMLQRSIAGGLALSSGALAVNGDDEPASPIVNTKTGRMRGASARGVHAFKGVPYGAAPNGRNRFLPPRPPAPWVGVRDALRYGPRAMQVPFNIFQTPAAALWPVTPDQLKAFESAPSEDCLYLNVWTPGLGPNVKRPVMVWLHGGGFSLGAATDPLTEGSHLAQRNDVVVVSVGHRLNVFGHLFLDDLGGPEWAGSGNAGMLDIVAALGWVRDNIAEFGGDPANVTVFGESGGGSKIIVLMGMPAAQGLFQKAIIQSGQGLKWPTAAQATRTAEHLLAQLNIGTHELGKLSQLTAQDILDARASINEEDWPDGSGYHAFVPVVDGHVLRGNPFNPSAPDESARVPILIGTTDDEARLEQSWIVENAFSLDEGSLITTLKSRNRMRDEEVEPLVKAYRRTRPNASASDIFFAVMSDLEYRMEAIEIAERKAAQGRTRVFMYLFSWKSRALGGMFGSHHGADLPFVFNNVESIGGEDGPERDPRRYELAATFGRAWSAFARTGNPNHSGLPEWKPYTAADRTTMRIDYVSASVNDPRGADRTAIEKVFHTRLIAPS